jgi:hypothetical protein
MSGANRTILAWTSVAVRAVTPMATRRAGRGQSATVGRSRLIAGLALFALAAITAIISYLHALAIVRPVGNIGAVAYLPFVADLMIPSAPMALLEAARNGRSQASPGHRVARVQHWRHPGYDVAAGLHHGTAGAQVAALPPVALALSLETLIALGRRSRARDVPPGDSHAGRPLVDTFSGLRCSRKRVSFETSDLAERSVCGTPVLAREARIVERWPPMADQNVLSLPL